MQGDRGTWTEPRSAPRESEAIMRLSRAHLGRKRLVNALAGGDSETRSDHLHVQRAEGFRSRRPSPVVLGTLSSESGTHRYRDSYQGKENTIVIVVAGPVQRRSDRAMCGSEPL